jgi:muconolactone delta-isomerase
MVKADLNAGAMKDGGCEPGGWSGYAIHEASSETELNASLQKYIPYIHFEVTPVRSHCFVVVQTGFPCI